MPTLRRRIIFWVVLGLCVGGAPALIPVSQAYDYNSAFRSSAGSFAEFDRKMREIDERINQANQDVDAQLAAIERSLQAAFAELGHEMETIWGDAAMLPSQKVWVGFPRDKETRVVVDYEKGEIAVESVDPNVDEGDLQQILRETLRADSQRLDRQDLLRRRQQEILEREPVQMPKAPARVRPPQPMELGQLVRPGVKPDVSRRPVRDGRGETKEVKRISVPMREGHSRLTAEQLREPVTAFSDRYNLPRALTLAVIKQESAFNPRAVSPANAYGLMQLVPTSGGRDAYRERTGKDQPPPVELLFQPVDNIDLGTTYLHILNTRYLRSITKADNRFFCMIAAYNTGAGNVARAFTGNTNIRAAGPTIDAMSAAQVKAHLIRNLPWEETQTYVRKVTANLREFADWDR